MRRVRSLLVAAAVLLAVPAAAQAATLDAARSCYPVGDDAVLRGSGYAPNSPMSFTVNGRQLAANVSSDEAGDVRVTYRDLPPTSTERRLVIRATDSENTSAETVVFVTRELRVTAKPNESPNVRRWRAVFSLWGFGRGRAYIHYLNPKGKHKKTVRIGRLIGPCGRLRTPKRRVMPFRDPAYGDWRLQFDTRRRYSENTVRKRVVPVRVWRG